MAIDQYSYCLCHSGKKIKFCCGKQILPQLEKILKAIDSDQRLVALSHIDSTIASHGKLPCLMQLKLEVFAALGKFDDYRQTADEFLAEHPRSLAAREATWLMQVVSGDLGAVIAGFETIAEIVQETKTISGQVVETTLKAAELAVSQRQFLPARGLLMFLYYNGVEGADEHLLRFDLTQQPMVLRNLFLMEPITDEEAAKLPWFEQYKDVATLGGRGRWRAAVEQVQPLVEQHAQEPHFARLKAMLLAFLLDDEARDAWRAYADIESLDSDLAIEAEAIAQELYHSGDPTVDMVRVRFPIQDLEKLTEALISSPRTISQEGDLNRYAEEDETPRNVFGVLDREPSSEEDQSAEDIAQALGVAYVFGKTTEHEARLEFQALKDHRFDERVESLRSIVSDCVGEAGEPTVVAPLAESVAAIFDSPHIPENINTETAQRLMEELERKVFFVQWLNTPQSLYGGVTPAEACADPALQRKLLGQILLYEYEPVLPPFDFNDLRKELNLPTRDPVSVAGPISPLTIRPAMLRCLQLEAMEIDDLFAVFQLGRQWADLVAVTNAAKLLIEKDTSADIKQMCYLQLARTTPDMAVAKEYCRKGREITAAQGQPVGRWLLMEAELALNARDGVEFKRLLEAATSRHMNEPGVAEGVMRLFQMIGVDPSQLAAAAAPTAGAAPPAPAAAEGLWTPDSPASPSEESSSESKLWVPGMD